MNNIDTRDEKPMKHVREMVTEIVNTLNKEDDARIGIAIIGTAIKIWCEDNILDEEAVFKSLYMTFMTKRSIEQKIKEVDNGSND